MFHGRKNAKNGQDADGSELGPSCRVNPTALGSSCCEVAVANGELRPAFNRISVGCLEEVSVTYCHTPCDARRKPENKPKHTLLTVTPFSSAYDSSGPFFYFITCL
jgi:hypothetical protein